MGKRATGDVVAVALNLAVILSGGWWLYSNGGPYHPVEVVEPVQLAER